MSWAPPWRIPGHAQTQAHQPQGQRRRQVAPRAPGIAIVHPHRHRSAPALEEVAQIGLHHSGGQLGEVALGGKHGCAALPLRIRRPPVATRSAGHRPAVSGQRHRPPRLRAGAQPAASTWPGRRPGGAGAMPCWSSQHWIVRTEGSGVSGFIRPKSTRMRPAHQRGCSRRSSRMISSSGGAASGRAHGVIAGLQRGGSAIGPRPAERRRIRPADRARGRSSWRAMSEAVAPSRTLRSRANRRESSGARGIEVDSPKPTTSDMARTVPGDCQRETSCRDFA